MMMMMMIWIIMWMILFNAMTMVMVVGGCSPTANTYCTKMSEKLCLKWNDYQDNVNSAFALMRGENDYADVTLACEDGQQMEAHKSSWLLQVHSFRGYFRRANILIH